MLVPGWGARGASTTRRAGAEERTAEARGPDPPGSAQRRMGGRGPRGGKRGGVRDVNKPKRGSFLDIIRSRVADTRYFEEPESWFCFLFKMVIVMHAVKGPREV